VLLHWVLFFAILLVVGLALWVFYGKAVVGSVDRFFLVPDRALPATPTEIREREIVVGDRKWPLEGGEKLRYEIKHRQKGCRFVFGGISFCVAAEAGDAISMTTGHSRLFWPKLFEINWLGGSVSRWRRNAYDRLVWTKSSGQRLEMVWRHEEWFYQRSGWCDVWDLRLIVIRLDWEPIEGIVAGYLRKEKGWPRGFYWIEDGGSENDIHIVAAIHRDDERADAPGAGKSLVLHVDPSSRQVVKEIGGQ
jgi:hypothetical protein